MKSNRVLLTLVAFSLAIVGAFASSFLTTYYGQNPYNGNVCTAAQLTPGQSGCGTGDGPQCTVRFVNPENSSQFQDKAAWVQTDCTVQLKRPS
jgi:hypothetical protein